MEIKLTRICFSCGSKIGIKIPDRTTAETLQCRCDNCGDHADTYAAHTFGIQNGNSSPT